MKHTKKAKYVFIPIRNLLVVCLCAFFVLLISEKMIEIKNREGDISVNEQKKEDFSIRYMNFKKDPINVPNDYNSKSMAYYFKRYGLEELLDYCSYDEYPLVDVYGKKQYPEDTFNIVVVGDSFVWGDGCTNRNELFWRLLEQKLEEKGYKCRVYGVGTAGATAYEELLWLTGSEMIEDLSPDIMILGFVENDPDAMTTIQSLQQKNLTEIRPFFKWLSKTLPGVYDSLAEKIRVDTLFTKKYGENLNGKDVSVLTGAIYDHYKNQFVKPLDTFAAKADFPVVYMTLPREPYRYYFKKLYKPLHELYSSAGNVVFYDCLDAFCDFADKKHEGHYAESSVNQHPGPATNYFYAEYILSFLENDFSLAEKCGRTEEKDNSIYINDTMPGSMNITEVSSSRNEAVYRFTYPSENTVHETKYYSFKDFLYLPIREDYIKLCFSHPVDISSISFSCEDAEEINLYYTRINDALGYDDHSVIPVEKDGDGAFMPGNSGLSAVTALCVHADIKEGNASNMVVTINGEGGN